MICFNVSDGNTNTLRGLFWRVFWCNCVATLIFIFPVVLANDHNHNLDGRKKDAASP